MALKSKVEMQSLQVRGLPLYYLLRKRGAQAPLVLALHGFPDTAWVWEKLFEALPESYSLLAPFVHACYVKSKVPPQRYSLESWGLDLLTLLKEVDPAQERDIYLLAHDLGGPYARVVADDLGARCKGLIYINSLGLDQYLSRMNNLQQWLKSYYIGLFQLKPFPELMFKTLHPLSLQRIYDFGGVEKTDAMRKAGPEVFEGIEQYRQILKSGPAMMLKKSEPYPQPALFIWGAQDPFLEIPDMPELQRFYAQAQIRVLEGNHWVLRNQARHIARYIRQFIGGPDA